MYHIEKQGYFTDTMTVGHDGVVDLELPIEIHLDDVIAAVGAAQRQINAAQEVLRRTYESENALDMAEATHGVISAYKQLIYGLFGDAVADKLDAYYCGRWSEIMHDTCPYVYGVVIPVINQQQADISADYLSAMR